VYIVVVVVLASAMMHGLFAAILDWLTGLVKSQTRTAGEDAQAKPGLREALDRRLAEWKARKGAG
jgi:hypothetical protein